jgi:hypothetical protein
MALLARCRLALARWPWIHWLVVAVCAAVVWLSVHHAQAAAHAAERRWGTQRTVWVSTADTPAGASLHLVRRHYPIAMVPPSAIVTPPTSPVAARAVTGGVVVVSADLGGLHDPPSGWVVFALPAEGAPTLHPGDPATLFGAGERVCDGVVAAVGSSNDSGTAATVEVAVAPRCAPLVSQQVVAHSIVLARAVPSRP